MKVTIKQLHSGDEAGTYHVFLRDKEGDPDRKVYEVKWAMKHLVLLKFGSPIGVFHNIGEVVKHFSVDTNVLCVIDFGIEICKPLKEDTQARYDNAHMYGGRGQDKSQAMRDWLRAGGWRSFDTSQYFGNV